jgi:hypothetical protein
MKQGKGNKVKKFLKKKITKMKKPNNFFKKKHRTYNNEEKPLF